MELRIAHSVCTEIPKTGDIRKNKARYRSDTEKTVRGKKGVDYRRGSVPRPCPFAGEHPPNISISQFMGYLKGKSPLMIFDRHANLKYKYGNRHFWCRGYYVDTVERNKERIAEYIRNQLQEDTAYDQLSFKEYIDPFTGSKNIKA